MLENMPGRYWTKNHNNDYSRAPNAFENSCFIHVILALMHEDISVFACVAGLLRENLESLQKEKKNIPAEKFEIALAKKFANPGQTKTVEEFLDLLDDHAANCNCLDRMITTFQHDC